jgi:hypothetical protein
LKIADNEFNRDMSKYITSRKNKGKKIHVQVYDAIKETRKKLGSIGFSKSKTELEVFDMPAEDKQEDVALDEEYKELEDLEKKVKEEKKSFWNILMNFFKTQPKEEGQMEEVEELKEEYEDLDDMEEDVEELEEQIEEKKESIFKKLLNVFKTNPKDEVEEFDEMLDLNEDVKEVIKILTNWIKQLPLDKLKEFKNSEDFQKYKEVLNNYNLIKKKQEVEEIKE